MKKIILSLLFLLFGCFMLTTAKAERCWVSTKLGPGGVNGYNVSYTTVNIGGDTRSDLVCSGSGLQACVWPVGSGYNGPPPIFLPPNETFLDFEGNIMIMTGAELNALIVEQYNQGNLSGTIVVGGLATFTFVLSSDLSYTEVKQL